MSAKSKSDRFRRLISHGFFAPELPPCFISEDLAKFRQSIWKTIFAIPPKQRGQLPGYQTFISETSSFYFPRFGRDDRKHGVINPVSYLAIAHTISENFVSLRRITKKSGISSSPLIFDWSGQRALFRPSVDLRDDFRVDLASRSETFIIADIRSFFHSIYTHSIPWSIYGKPWAKKNRKVIEYGNSLDLLCRNAQDGQTIGLPVGPDTSRLLAEIVASAIDTKLRIKLNFKAKDASRYIDDYTIGGSIERSGESLIAALRQTASEFELDLNNDKSEIHSGSFKFNVGWKQAALAHIPRKDLDTKTFHRFFYEVQRICEEQPYINVEKYAFQNARSAFVNALEWPQIQNYLMNAYRGNPSLISFLAEVLILRDKQVGDLDKQKLQSFLTGRIPTLASENRTGEIIWLIFLSIRLKIILPSSAILSLLHIENAMIALLVTYAKHFQFISGTVDFSYWGKSINADGLTGPMWLYVYQSVLLGINPVGNSEFIKQSPFFSEMFSKKVSFLSMDSGFTSVSNILRKRKRENDAQNLLRADFIDDFDFETDELEDIDENEYMDENEDFY